MLQIRYKAIKNIKIVCLILLLFSIKTFSHDKDLFASTQLSNLSQQNLPKIVTNLEPLAAIAKSIAISEDQVVVVGGSHDHHQHFNAKDLKQIEGATIVMAINQNGRSPINKILRNSKVKQIYIENLPQIKILKNFYNNDNDWHLWLSPDNALVVANYLVADLIKSDPNNRDKYQEKLVKFLKDHKKLIVEARKTLDQMQISGKYIFFHNGFRYFEDFFKLQPAVILKDDHEDAISSKALWQIDALRNRQLNNRQGAKCLIVDEINKIKAATKIANSQNLQLVIIDNLWKKPNTEFGNKYHQEIYFILRTMAEKCS
jgi:ABC-type Zn uptake system ZnuABC Zn-binding protein ZnuA